MIGAILQVIAGLLGLGNKVADATKARSQEEAGRVAQTAQDQDKALKNIKTATDARIRAERAKGDITEDDGFRRD